MKIIFTQSWRGHGLDDAKNYNALSAYGGQQIRRILSWRSGGGGHFAYLIVINDEAFDLLEKIYGDDHRIEEKEEGKLLFYKSKKNSDYYFRAEIIDTKNLVSILGFFFRKEASLIRLEKNNLIIPSKIAGIIIGKGGINAKFFREILGIRVVVS